MFTVIIAEKKHIDAVKQENKLFFEPFLESKNLAFCEWNPMGQDLADSVPGLQDTIGRKKEWRAVLIQPNTADTMKERNPFDVVEYGNLSSIEPPRQQPGPDESWDEWEAEWKGYYESLTKEKEIVYRSALTNPLQKLSTWICFKPEDYILNDVENAHDLFDWERNAGNHGVLKPSHRLTKLEQYQYKVEMSLKESLRREFAAGRYLNIAYPSEIHCISLRTTENSFFDPGAYWNIREENEYSAFADRNMYFDKMRFMVFDLFPETHKDYRTDYIRFLASVLIFASNPVPGSVMQARRLYALETETDDTPLCTLVTSYDKKLASTLALIDNEMEQIRGDIPGELTDKVAEKLFCTPQDIQVVQDEDIEEEKLFVDEKYGLAFDCPQDEHAKWNDDSRESEKELAYTLKQQMRSIRKSVTQMHIASTVSDVNIGRLTPFQIDDVRDYTDACENEMVESMPPDFADMAAYSQRIADQGENVKKIINQRMTRTTTLVLGLICLLVFLICFLPFLTANRDGYTTASASAALGGAMAGIFVLVMLISLFKLRRILKQEVKAYNAAMKEIMEELELSMKRVSKYLSAVCNVRRGQAVQHYALHNLDDYTKSLRIRKKHKEDIRKKKAYLMEEYKDYYGGNAFCDKTMSQPYDYDFGERTEYTYPAPFLAGDYRQIEFLSNGNLVTVPSSYVTKISVRMEGIYEK